MRSKWSIITIYPLLLFLCVTGQDANFGKIVPCYVVEGTVVCPGCNSRAGLTCPRVIPDENKCNSSLSSTTTTTTTKTTTTIAPTDDKSVDETKPIDTSDLPTEVTNPPDSETTESEEGIIGPRHPTVEKDLAEKDLAMRIFLYRILRDPDNKRKPYFKIPRSLQSDERLEDGTCRWNGDCPCPRICCRNGEGQPMTCKKGIRLPPPWG